MLSYLISALYFLIPTAALIFFVGSLIAYLTATCKNKRTPGTYSPAQIKQRRLALIVSSVIAGILLLVVIVFFALLMTAVAFM